MKTVRPNPMANGEQRTCSSCCSFDEGACNNLIDGHISPDGVCTNHETDAEFDSDVRAIQVFRARLGLPRQRTYLDDDTGGPDAR